MCCPELLQLQRKQSFTQEEENDKQQEEEAEDKRQKKRRFQSILCSLHLMSVKAKGTTFLG
jgi:hypothetical protein